MLSSEKERILDLCRKKGFVTSTDISKLLNITNTKGLNLLRQLTNENALSANKKGRGWQFTITSPKETIPFAPKREYISSSSIPSSLVNRLESLEGRYSKLSSQVEFLIQEFAHFQKNFSQLNSLNSDNKLSQEQILIKLDDLTRRSSSKEKWITVENLFSSLLLKGDEWNNFENLIITMFDRRVIELIDGTSLKKIRMRGRSYALVKRK